MEYSDLSLLSWIRFQEDEINIGWQIPRLLQVRVEMWLPRSKLQGFSMLWYESIFMAPNCKHKITPKICSFGTTYMNLKVCIVCCRNGKTCGVNNTGDEKVYCFKGLVIPMDDSEDTLLTLCQPAIQWEKFSIVARSFLACYCSTLWKKDSTVNRSTLEETFWDST